MLLRAQPSLPPTLPHMQSDDGVAIRPCQDQVETPQRYYSQPLGCYLHYQRKGLPGSYYMFRTKQAALPTGSAAHCTSKGERRCSRHAPTVVCTLPVGHSQEEDSFRSLQSNAMHPNRAVVAGIRLVPGMNSPPNAGRLEVQVGGVWGTVCSELFGEREAVVACRQLGKKGGVPHSYSRYGAAPPS